MNLKYLVKADYPHSWNSGFTSRYETLDEAKSEARHFRDRSDPPGTEGYIHVTIWKKVEEENRDD